MRVGPICGAQRRGAATGAARIRQIVEECFGDEIRLPGDPRFAFVRRLSEPRTDFALPDSSAQRLFSPRFLCSYLKIYGDPLSDPQIDMYPEGLLQRLAEVGVDGVWLYGVLRELTPGGPQFPEFGEGHEARLANLRTLVARGKKYGIGALSQQSRSPRHRLGLGLALFGAGSD